MVQGKTKRISHRIHKPQRISKDDWIIIKKHHEAIISREDFDKVQDIIYERDIRVKQNNMYDLFAGYLYCKECGNSMGLKKWDRFEYYYCNSHLKNKKKYAIRIV